MRIELDVIGDKGERSLIATVLLNHSNIRKRRPARFVVDTGSPVTIISETLRSQLQISKGTLEYSEDFYGVGGGQMVAAKMNNVEFKFKAEGLTAGTEQDVMVAPDRQDNLLGLDFLEDNNFDLHCEKEEDQEIEAFLEKIESDFLHLRLARGHFLEFVHEF